MAVATTAILAGVTAATAIAGAATAMKAAHDQNKAAKNAQKELKKQVDATPVYSPKKETNKAANMAAAENKRRAMLETDTIKTSALGNVAGTQTQKKTLLGG